MLNFRRPKQFLVDERSPGRPILAQSTPAKQAWTSQSNQRISSTLPRQNFITEESKMSFPNDSAIEEEPSSGLVSNEFLFPIS